MSSSLEIVVNGRRYGGWKSIHVTRSIESLSGSFVLEVSDRWGAASEPWPIVEEDACRVEIDGVTVIDGYIDERSLSADANSRALSYSGRDRSAVLVDCSAVLPKWTYYGVKLAEFAAAVAKPFGIAVTLQPGLALPAIGKVAISPGDSAYEAIRRAAGEEGVLIVSDGAGGVLITRAGHGRAAALVEGQNILAASVAYNGAERFRRYVVSTQAFGTDEAAGDATRIQADATDEGVRRPERVLLLRPERGYSRADARKRADWEARIRAARAETVTITVLGWKQPSGDLWPLNAIAPVQAPRLIGVDGDMLISQVEHATSDAGQITILRLVRPDAFTPEPQAAVVRSSGGGWKELAKGGL